jgi:hypothetical protein
MENLWMQVYLQAGQEHWDGNGSGKRYGGQELEVYSLFWVSAQEGGGFLLAPLLRKDICLHTMQSRTHLCGISFYDSFRMKYFVAVLCLIWTVQIQHYKLATNGRSTE